MGRLKAPCALGSRRILPDLARPVQLLRRLSPCSHRYNRSLSRGSVTAEVVGAANQHADMAHWALHGHSSGRLRPHPWLAGEP